MRCFLCYAITVLIVFILIMVTVGLRMHAIVILTVSIVLLIVLFFNLRMMIHLIKIMKRGITVVIDKVIAVLGCLALTAFTVLFAVFVWILHRINKNDR